MKRAVSTEEATRIEQGRHDLLDIVDIGLNGRLRSISELSRFLSKADTLLPAAQIAEQMISNGRGLQEVMNDLDLVSSRYQEVIQNISKDNGFLPVPNLIEQRLGELVHLRDIRVGLRFR